MPQDTEKVFGMAMVEQIGLETPAISGL